MENSFLSKKQADAINDAVKDCFNTHAKAEVLLYTIDGNLFFENSENAAKNHARGLANKEVFRIGRGEEIEGTLPEVEKVETGTGEAAAKDGEAQVKHSAETVKVLVAEGKIEEAKAAFETLSKTQKGKLGAEVKTALAV